MRADERPTTLRTALLVLFFALYFYRVGAGNLEAFLNYPFWRDMGPMMSNADFISLREDHMWKVFPLLVLPVVMLPLATALLAILGASPVPRWAFLGALALQLIAVISTVLIQFPIQVQLTQSGFDAGVLDRLIVTDFWLRRMPSLGEGIFVLIALWRVIASERQISSVSRP